MTDFMDRHFRYLKAGQKEYTEAEVRAIIDGAIQEEREACAKLCDEHAEYAEKWGTWGQVMTFDRCATAIRARREQ